MGFRTSWIAVKGVPLPVLVEAVGLRDTGEVADVYDPGFYGLALPTGWVVVVGSGWDFMSRLTTALARAASGLGETLFLLQEDSAMVAELRAWTNGVERWALEYVGTDGVSEPEITGAVPREVDAIVARCRADQADAGGLGADVDFMYEIIPELGRLLIGFRHDEDVDAVIRVLETV